MIAGVPAPALALVETTVEPGTEGPDLTLYLLTCVLVIAGICGLGWLLRQFLARTVQARAAKRSLQVVDVLPLGGKQKLAVVRCYDRSFLLGLGEKEVRSIAELDVEALQPAADQPAEAEAKTIHPVRSLEDFEEALRQTREQERAVEAPAAAVPTPSVPRRPVLDDGRGILG